MNAESTERLSCEDSALRESLSSLINDFRCVLLQRGDSKEIVDNYLAGYEEIVSEEQTRPDDPHGIYDPRPGHD